jgi:TolB-like protein
MAELLARMRQRKLVQWGLAYVAFAFALLQGLDVVAHQFGWPDGLQRGITLVLVVGFFVAIVLAWYHGERGVQRVGGTELLIVALLLAIGGALIWRFAAVGALLRTGSAANIAAPGGRVVVRSPAVNDKSIAVLPFANMSSDKDDAYFADGLSEEIINSLTRVPDLQVAARTSSFAFRNAGKTIPQIAAELHVADVLEGSVRRAGDRLRITVQLIRALDGFELWSEDYDRNSSDVIAIQEDVAKSIAEAMRTATDPKALAAMQRAGTRSVPAYDAYLHGLALLEQSSANGDAGTGQVRAQAAFDRAIALDPSFVDAYAHSADLQWSRLRPVSIGSPESEADYPGRIERLRRDLDRAAGLARTTAEGDYYAALRASLDQRYVEASRLMSAYARTYPNDVRASGYLAGWALYAGDYRVAGERAEALTKPAAVEQTLYAPIALLIWAREYSRAEAVARQEMKKRPDSIETLYNAHRALLGNGHAAEAATLLPRLEASELDDSIKLLAKLRQLCAEGRATEAARLYSDAMQRGRLDRASQWHSLKLLGRDTEAAALLSPLDTPAYFNPLASFLSYPQFDVTRFPHLEAVLAAQGIHRPPAREPPFACKRGAAP